MLPKLIKLIIYSEKFDVNTLSSF